jgi:ethanolamine ammonia-lyase small subunit
MEMNQIRDVVKEVLSDVLKKELGGDTSKPESPVASKPAPSDKRVLAKENIARWLGQSATVPVSRVPKKVPGTFSATDSPEKPTGTLENKSLVPNARKPEKLEEMLKTTPARVGVWRTGTRYLTRVALKLRADHAVAKDAVYTELTKGFAESQGWIPLETKATSKEEFLLRPDLGRQLNDSSLKIVQEKAIKNPDIQITVADGLSSWAAERYAVPMVKELARLCAEKKYSVGTIFCVHYSRIAIQDVIGEAVGAKVSMILLGERPGLGSGDSLSNYIVYGPKIGIVNAKKSMISNIHPAGHKPEEAARLTMYMIEKMFEQKTSGVELKV